MSEKCCSTALLIGISIAETPSSRIISVALPCVRPVVSEAGHCYARYPFAVESEDVESLYCHEQCERGVKSPDMPTVRCLHPVASRRCTSPAACMEDISSQRDARPSESEGTNGVGSMVRMRQSLTSGITVCAHRIVLYGCASSFSENVCIYLRSSISRSKSVSAMERSCLRENLFSEASMRPSSAIMALPENTRSVDDSPAPADA